MKQAAQKALPLIVGAFLMLVIAAFIEAFWSPRDIANEVKYLVGSGCWAYVIFRLYRECAMELNRLSFNPRKRSAYETFDLTVLLVKQHAVALVSLYL